VSYPEKVAGAGLDGTYLMMCRDPPGRLKSLATVQSTRWAAIGQTEIATRKDTFVRIVGFSCRSERIAHHTLLASFGVPDPTTESPFLDAGLETREPRR